MSDDDDFDISPADRSSKNLASLFHGGQPAVAAPPVATTRYVPPTQPKKDSPPRVMVASVVQAFSFNAEQKWTTRGKMGVALLSTENSIFQLIVYVTKTQHITSLRIQPTSVFASQTNNYLTFQDDSGVNWSIMFDNKQVLIDFVLQILVAKAFLLGMKFEQLTQEIREGEGSSLVDQDGVEITAQLYKLLDNGTLSTMETGETKPVRLKIGKAQNGKIFDDVLKGMKKNGHRLAMIGTMIYSIEVLRIKREKETRTNSITSVQEEPPAPVERKATATSEDNDHPQEKNKMMQRINKMGGVSMLPNPNSSAFAAPLPSYSDDDSINNEFMPQVPRAAAPPLPVQFVPPTYHHPYLSAHLYPQQQQQAMPDYHSRPTSSMGPTGYPPMSNPWVSNPYPPPAPSVPPPDPYYSAPIDVRQLFHRLSEKVDSLTEKIETKSSLNHPNMETSILLANIQRIVKDNETMKKDLFDRSAKVEEQNLKISDLLDRNQRLIEQSHQTAEQRNVVVNNVSEQTATRILDLEKQKVELTNNLSLSTSKIADLQLQNNQLTQTHNEDQSRILSLVHQAEQAKEQTDRAEIQRLEIQQRLDTLQEQLKGEKLTRKQLENQKNHLEEELAEVKVTLNAFEKNNNERKAKQDQERRRWQDDLDDQKQSYEKELDELRAKLRKQRTTDSQLNNQEITRIEEDLAREWQEKLDRQQTAYERLLVSKGKELDQLKATFNEQQTKLEETLEELNQSQTEIGAYEERCEKLQERLASMKEKWIEMQEEQSQSVNDEVKRAMNLTFQRLKTRFQVEQQYKGDEILSRSLDVIKKVTINILSNTEEEEEEEEDEVVEEKKEEEIHKDDDQPTNGDNIDQQTLTEEVTSTENNQPKINNGWDTVDDLPKEDPPSPPPAVETPVKEEEQKEQEQEQEEETAPPVPDEQDSDTAESTSQVELPKDPISDEEENNESFQSARPSVQEVAPTPPRYTFNENMPLMSNPADESDDELFK